MYENTIIIYLFYNILQHNNDEKNLLQLNIFLLSHHSNRQISLLFSFSYFLQKFDIFFLSRIYIIKQSMKIIYKDAKTIMN